MKPMLLWSNYHTGTHEAHVSDDFIGGEGMLIDQISSNEAASSTKSSFAVNSDTLLAHRNHFMRKIDELAHER